MLRGREPPRSTHKVVAAALATLSTQKWLAGIDPKQRGNGVAHMGPMAGTITQRSRCKLPHQIIEQDKLAEPIMKTTGRRKVVRQAHGQKLREGSPIVVVGGLLHYVAHRKCRAIHPNAMRGRNTAFGERCKQFPLVGFAVDLKAALAVPASHGKAHRAMPKETVCKWSPVLTPQPLTQHLFVFAASRLTRLGGPLV